MKILQYFEKAWIAATAAALVVAVYNLIHLRTFDRHVYFPLFCAMFCVLIWYNIRGQRRFKDKMDEEQRRRAEESKPKP